MISATGCASRYTLLPAGAGLILCAFFPSVVGMLVTIPGVVMGAILLYLMATQLAAGLQMLVREKAITDFDSGVVVGLPLMVAFVVVVCPGGSVESDTFFVQADRGEWFRDGGDYRVDHGTLDL